MTDQCTHCTLRGNFAGCQSTPCGQHESWMVVQLKQQRDELLNALKYAAGCLRTDGNDPIDFVIKKVEANK